MMIDVHDTLGALVTANPTRARALEGLDLDYCCEGRRSLTDACLTAGRDIDDVIAVLEGVDARSIDPVPVWAELRLDDLLDHIVDTHHAYLRAEAPRLLDLGRKVLGVHGDRHPELSTVVATVEQLWAELEPHLEEEEQGLFPKLHALDAGDGTLEIDLTSLRDEHDSVGALLDRVREDTSVFQPPADGCASYQAFYAGLAELDADTRLHVHKENNIVFPTVSRVFGELRTARRDHTDEVTEIKIAGANCPVCLNDALDQLRSLDGVTSVHSSMTGECIQVVHRHVDLAVLLGTVRATVHGIDTSSYEYQMVEIDVEPVVIHCTHGKP
jgi:regulator of cell morphogenesis and NO signaling